MKGRDMAQARLKFDAPRRTGRGWAKDMPAKRIPTHPHSRDADFDPVHEGQASAATSIEAFKKALDEPVRRKSK
jgi:hypothetical protein